MIEQIRQRRLAEPFVPFIVRTNDGKQFFIPSPKHVTLNPKRTYALVLLPDDTHVTLREPSIAGVGDHTT